MVENTKNRLNKHLMAKAYVVLTQQTIPKKNGYIKEKIGYNAQELVHNVLYLVHSINREHICQVIHTGLV